MSDGIKVLLGAVVGALLTLLLVGVFSGGGMMSGGMMAGGMIGMSLMLLFWVLVLALIVAAVVWVVNQAWRH
jgi:uncharacterized membrane protein